jgi:hypothetical protein
MPDVVVLPFVALTTSDPRSSRRDSSPTARGSIRSSSFPGRLVPPPRRLARDNAPTARESPTLARSIVKTSRAVARSR